MDAQEAECRLCDLIAGGPDELIWSGLSPEERTLLCKASKQLQLVFGHFVKTVQCVIPADPARAARICPGLLLPSVRPDTMCIIGQGAGRYAAAATCQALSAFISVLARQDQLGRALEATIKVSSWRIPLHL